MAPDHKAALKELDFHARALDTDLQSVALSPGVNRFHAKLARHLLKRVVEHAKKALEKGAK